MASCITRSKTEDAIFGQPPELPRSQLPTGEDIIKLYLLRYHADEQAETIHERSKSIASEVKEAYNRASIPTIGMNSITVHVKRIILQMHELKKYPEAKQSSTAFINKVNSFKKLFDVCSCKCFDHGVDREQCKCAFALKIPAREWTFWVDQKTVRKMMIAEVDMKTTAKLTRKEIRKARTR